MSLWRRISGLFVYRIPTADELVEILLDKRVSMDDRVSSAITLMEVDHALAEQSVVGLIDSMSEGELSEDEFEFFYDLIDVAFDDWAELGQPAKAHALIKGLSGQRRAYAKTSFERNFKERNAD